MTKNFVTFLGKKVTDSYRMGDSNLSDATAHRVGHGSCKWAIVNPASNCHGSAPRDPCTPLQCGSQSDWRPAYVRSIRWKLLTSCAESGSNFRRAGCETRRMRRRRPEFSNHAIRDSAIIGLRVGCGSVARGLKSAGLCMKETGGRRMLANGTQWNSVCRTQTWKFWRILDLYLEAEVSVLF